MPGQFRHPGQGRMGLTLGISGVCTQEYLLYSGYIYFFQEAPGRRSFRNHPQESSSLTNGPGCPLLYHVCCCLCQDHQARCFLFVSWVNRAVWRDWRLIPEMEKPSFLIFVLVWIWRNDLPWVPLLVGSSVALTLLFLSEKAWNKLV